MKQKKLINWIPEMAAGVVLLILSILLLNRDSVVFLTWYVLALVMGLAFMPVTGRLFFHFSDKGWAFSKALAIAVCGFAEWYLVSIRLISFTSLTSILVTIALCGICFVQLLRKDTAEKALPAGHARLIVLEELIFFGIFLMWTYIAGFHPEAYGTEKFMDYGFMEAMMRSEVLPAVDLWYSEGTINYYYGGQYFAVFLTKISGAHVEQTYNLMRTFVAAFAFLLPFSLVNQMLQDLFQRKVQRRRRVLPIIGGVIAGTAVSLAGNMHYVIYGCIIPTIQKLQGKEVSSYWFPDATRYIGFDPDVADKTIHEFPCYSFVLGDLHAHVVNILFVLLLLGILYAGMQTLRLSERPDPEKQFPWKKELFQPHILLSCCLLGMYQLTNYWDFVIYFVVTGGVILFVNVIRYCGRIRRVLGATLIHALEMILISKTIILPFTLQFDTMVSGVRLAQNHSLPHQLLVLWGIPVLVTVCLIISLARENLKVHHSRGIYEWMENTSIPDLFAFITGLCAIGLILIPELVYVRDIYENGNARANTMFKLTYQAYIMFGITIAYAMIRIIMVSGEKILKILAWAALFFWVWTVGYFGRSVESWFGNVFQISSYKGLDALTYLERDFPEDAAAIRWLKENIEDSPVVLEANGDSYTGYERVSASTGLPTVLGWYVHEWLWRNDTADLNEKSADIQTIYSSKEEELVRDLIEEYNISYIFVGSKEAEKYGEDLNTELLRSLGEIVFEDPVSGTFIVQVYS